MKKLIPFLLALSLVANAALIITRPGGKSPAPSASARATKTPKTAAERAAAAVASLPDDAELATLQNKLTAAGFSDEIAREVVRAMLWKPLRDRQRAMLDAKNAGKPYWQQTATSKNQLTAAERSELRSLSEQIEARAANVLGDEYAGAAATRYAFLPPEKAAAIQQLRRDYGSMQDNIADETSAFRVPSDDASRRLLRQEQRRDLEAILSPAELAEYDLRYSPTSHELRKHFSGLPDSTEAEYKAAFDIAQSLNNSKNNSAAQALAAQQLRDLLGPERYTAFLRANDSDYAALQGAATRFDIPASTVDKVYGLRDQAVSLSQQIASDKSLSLGDRQQALRSLSNQIRNDVRASLGDEVGSAYLEKNMTWLNSLANGNVLNASPTGKITARPATKSGKNSKSQGGKKTK